MKENWENFKWFWKDCLKIFKLKQWYLFPYFCLALIVSFPITLFLSLFILTEDPAERKKHEEDLDYIFKEFTKGK